MKIKPDFDLKYSIEKTHLPVGTLDWSSSADQQWFVNALVNEQYLGADVWGGELGGACNNVGVLSSQTKRAYYWSIDDVADAPASAYPLMLNKSMGQVDIKAYMGKINGYMVRCVK